MRTSVNSEHPNIEEVEDEERAPVILDLQEYRRRQAYMEFWNDPCWQEEQS